jgi:carbon storage regulator
MLVLSRKQDEEILIGDNVCVKVVRVFGNKVLLGMSAPVQVMIRRAELDFSERTSDRSPELGHPETIASQGAKIDEY